MGSTNDHRYASVTGLASLAALLACGTTVRDPEQDPQPVGASASADDAAETGMGAGENGPAEDSGTDTGAPDGSHGGSSTGEDEATDDSDDANADTGGPEPWPEVDCVAGNDRIWVLARDPDDGDLPKLHRFDPELVELSWAADLSCLTAYDLSGPLSLAVDRAGTGYLSGASPELLLRLPVVDDDPCAGLVEASWNGPSPYARLAFRSEDLFEPGVERLFAFMPKAGGGWYGEIFHHLDDDSLALLSTASSGGTQLVGTGDGQLFGAGFDRRLHTIDPDLGAELPISGAPVIEDWPLAAYDGAVLVFVTADESDQGGAVPGIFRFALDGTAAYELVVGFDELPALDLLDATSSTCTPTPFG